MGARFTYPLPDLVDTSIFFSAPTTVEYRVRPTRRPHMNAKVIVLFGVDGRVYVFRFESQTLPFFFCFPAFTIIVYTRGLECGAWR